MQQICQGAKFRVEIITIKLTILWIRLNTIIVLVFQTIINYHPWSKHNNTKKYMIIIMKHQVLRIIE